MSNTAQRMINNGIRKAIDEFDFETARISLKTALKLKPDADTYYLASMLAENEKEKLKYLEKALDKDPFHEEAFAEYEHLTQPESVAYTRSKSVALSKSKTSGETGLFSRIMRNGKELLNTTTGRLSVAAGVVILALVVLVSVNLTGSAEISVSATNGASYESRSLPSVYIPPNAVESNTKLSITEIRNPKTFQSAILVGDVYDINLSDSSLREPIEIAFPVENSTDSEYLTIAYYEDHKGWITVPSWVSEDNKTIHATVDHLTPFGVFKLFHRKPQIVYKQAFPSRYTGVGFPSCFDKGLKIQISVDDPDDRLQLIQTRLRIYSFNTGLLTALTEHVAAESGLGLGILAGDITAVLPATQTLVELSKTKDSGLVTDWTSISASNNSTYTIVADMSNLSACNTSSLHGVNVNSVLNQQNGITRISVEIQMIDKSNKIYEDMISIPVSQSNPPYAKLHTPYHGSTQTATPFFSWTFENINFLGTNSSACLIFAKGSSQLWGKWFGKKVIKLSQFESTKLLETSLSPGNYIWGISVSKNGDCESKEAVRSEIFNFTVKSWNDIITEFVDSGCSYAVETGANGNGEIELTGAGGGIWTISINNNGCKVSKGSMGNPDAKLTISAVDFSAILSGQTDPIKLFSEGRIIFEGDPTIIGSIMLR
jgi:putative sterol carrier protein